MSSDENTERLGADRIAARVQIVELQGDIAALTAASADDNGDDEHDPEGATVAYERELLNARLGTAQRRLEDIDAAIARVEGGIYGRCLICGRPIDAERLTARPSAERCRNCA